MRFECVCDFVYRNFLNLVLLFCKVRKMKEEICGIKLFRCIVVVVFVVDFNEKEYIVLLFMSMFLFVFLNVCCSFGC